MTDGAYTEEELAELRAGRLTWATPEITAARLLATVADRDEQIARMRDALVIARTEIKATGEAEGVLFGDRPDVVEVIDAALAGGVP